MDPADKLIAELRQAISARDDFLAITAHELRNPLTPISLCVDLIRAAVESSDRTKIKLELDRLERQIKHFITRTKMLLEVAQINSGKLALKPARLNLSEVVAAVASDYGPLAARSGCEIKLTLEDEVIVLADELAAAEIIENLLSNAIKYGQSKPIEIILTATADEAQITIRDQGVGIALKDQARIFERFERAVGSRVQSGFGIGLWLSRNLAELMGGSITVAGEAGIGSLFTLSLPMASGEINEQ